MKRIIAGMMAGLMLAALCGCGTPEQAAESTSAVETTQEASTVYEFAYAKKELPKEWTVLERFGTSSYLEAVYGDGKDENAPSLSVSVFHYSDENGPGKAKLLADAVNQREKKSSKIQTRRINGTEFYYLSFPSPQVEKKLRYEFYGQTEPDKDNKYDFFMIVLDKIADAEQFKKLEPVLDCIDFTGE